MRQWNVLEHLNLIYKQKECYKQTITKYNGNSNISRLKIFDQLRVWETLRHLFH